MLLAEQAYKAFVNSSLYPGSVYHRSIKLSWLCYKHSNYSITSLTYVIRLVDRIHVVLSSEP